MSIPTTNKGRDYPASRVVFTKLAEYAGRVATGGVKPDEAIDLAASMAEQMPGYKADKFRRHAEVERDMRGVYVYGVNVVTITGDHREAEVTILPDEVAVFECLAYELKRATMNNKTVVFQVYRYPTLVPDSEGRLDEFENLLDQREIVPIFTTNKLAS